MKRSPYTDAFLSAKRKEKRLKRRSILLERAKSQRGALGYHGRGVRIWPQSLVGWLADQDMFTNHHDIRSLLTLRVPETFSVINNPEALIDLLSSLVAVARHADRVGAIFFDHSKMQTYDLAAEQVLDTVASEIERAYRTAGRRLRTGGRYPAGDVATRFLKGIGIIRHLNVAHEYGSVVEQQKIEIFVAHRRQGAEEVVYGSNDRKSLETKRFVDHINNCLQRNGRRLSGVGIERLATCTGEILANAEEHSGRGEWLLAGYLDNSAEGHVCEIAVLSFGHSFCDTFIRLPPMSFPRSQVQPYLDAHSEKRLFSRHWTVEDLLTVVALQGGISSKNATARSTRGKGTVDLISFFEQMHEECAEGSSTPCEMAILSGQTHIRFDGTYRLRRDSSDRDIIAFNESNSLDEPPDSKFVRHLKYRFPGTIISMRFSLLSADTQSGLTIEQN